MVEQRKEPNEYRADDKREQRKIRRCSVITCDKKEDSKKPLSDKYRIISCYLTNEKISICEDKVHARPFRNSDLEQLIPDISTLAGAAAFLLS